MKSFFYLNISWLFVLASALSGCITMPKTISDQQTCESIDFEDEDSDSDKPLTSKISQPTKTKAKDKVISVDIPLILPSGPSSIRADIYRPEQKVLPKTLLILAPGSGHVSRKGEITGDGINIYDEAVEQNVLWAEALAQNGFFILSYDKRSCLKSINTICQDHSQLDIDENGIKALSSDLDQVYDFALEKLRTNNEDVRILIMSSTQGAQVLSQSKRAKQTSALILLSPIIGDLELSWVNGLKKAQHALGEGTRKNNLKNQAEATTAFFSSLRKGDFPPKANIRGASVEFWLSWLQASLATKANILDLKRPVLMLFSKSDVFTTDEILKDMNLSAANNMNLKVKLLINTDRNFIYNKKLSESALNNVVDFIKSTRVIKTNNPVELDG